MDDIGVSKAGLIVNPRSGRRKGAGLATEIWVARNAGAMRGDVPAGVSVASAARGGWRGEPWIWPWRSARLALT